ncbi:cellulase family glycosylhydrolase [Ideonella sp.]|uniref:cellulase family glycosylhydrolase n=1 Tax=Ideonella sp. TaxID=1929293 RepID=UPI0035B4A2E4
MPRSSKPCSWWRQRALFAAAGLCLAHPPLHAQCAAPPHAAMPAAPAPLHVDGPYFKDAQNRVVLLRGMNVSGTGKVPPFTLLSDAAQMTQLKTWGVNIIRLTFNWEAYEPTRCQYDAGYLGAYETIARWAEAAGIYVLVDFHQDTYSRYANHGCGDGFPSWAIAADLTRYQPDNGPSCQFLIPGWWGVSAFLDANYHATWHAFHADAQGIKSRFIEMVASVAEAMAQHGNVIGYDLMNEPWGYDHEMADVYNRASAVIRERHPGAILFYEPSADAAVVAAPQWTDANGQPHRYDNTVWAPHYYEFSANVLKNWMGASPDGTFAAQQAQAAANGSGHFLGEMGEWANTAHVNGYMESIYDTMDARFMSGAQWGYTPLWTAAKLDGWDTEDFSVVAEGRLRSQLYHPRYFPRATAGTPIAFRTQATSFSYTWAHDPRSGSTEVFIPAGYDVSQAIVTTTPSSLTCRVERPLDQQILRCSGPEAARSSVDFALAQPLVDGVVYRLTNQHTGLVADVANWSKNPGDSVHQWEYVGGANQQWKAVARGQGTWSFVSVNSGLCLSVRGDGLGKGRGIIQSPCSDTHPSQRIRLDHLGGNTFHLVFTHSNACLDDNNWSTGNGAWLQQWPCASPAQANQAWWVQVVQ